MGVKHLMDMGLHLHLVKMFVIGVIMGEQLCHVSKAILPMGIVITEMMIIAVVIKEMLEKVVIVVVIVKEMGNAIMKLIHDPSVSMLSIIKFLNVVTTVKIGMNILGV